MGSEEKTIEHSAPKFRNVFNIKEHYVNVVVRARLLSNIIRASGNTRASFDANKTTSFDSFTQHTSIVSLQVLLLAPVVIQAQ